MLELIGFITLLYLAIRFMPNILMFILKLAVVILLIILAVGAFEFIIHWTIFQNIFSQI